MKKNIILGFCLSLLLSGCYECLYRTIHFIHYEGTYRGKIVDLETGTPVEGVVVLGTWSRVHPNVAGASHEFYEARETVTGKNGEFSISGMGLKLFSNIEEMNVLIFKSGYEYIGTMPWATLRSDSTMLQKVKWEESNPIIRLRKLTVEERKKSISFPSLPTQEATLDKIRLMLHEINKEAIERGLQPIDIWRGEKIWEQ